MTAASPDARGIFTVAQVPAPSVDATSSGTFDRDPPG